VAGRRFHDGIGNTGVLPTGMTVNFGSGNTGHVDLISVIPDARGRKRLRLEFSITNDTGALQFPRFRFAEVAAASGEIWSASIFANLLSSSHAISVQLEGQAPTGGMLNANLAMGENALALHGGVFPAAGQTMLQ